MITSTVYSAKSTLDLSVMDVLPANSYMGNEIGFVVWNSLFDAIHTAVVTNGVRVRFLASSRKSSTAMCHHLAPELSTIRI